VRTSFWAAVVVLAVTFVFAAAGVNATTVGFAYLVTIFVIAAAWGLPPAIAASFTATTCFNYFFLPPIHTFSIAEPENWVALGAFLISSLIASQLSDREKRRAVEATSRQAEMEQLYALSRSLMQIDPSTAVGSQIALEVARTCGVSTVAIYNRSTDAVYGAGPGVIENVERRLRQVSAQDAVWEEPNALVWAPLRLGDHSLGGMVIQGGTLSKTAVQALTNLVGVSLENVRSREIAARAEAARHSEQFKSTLLDGLAHEFKTPLTSIKAATTALLAAKVSDAAQQSELLTIVDQEAERLSRLVTEATHLARVEAGKVQLSKRRCSVDALIRTALEGMEPTGDGRHFEVSVAPDLPDARIDADLMGLALRQLLDNAVKYSPQRSPIRVSAARCGNKIDVHVHNWGEPLPESEQERIFEKFYRGPNVRRHVAGTGMGLAIAREILIAHGGMIRVESTKESGTEFQMEFPYIQDSPA
jgi:two-component system, OmpR family, sensor histidine kinase KdpD